MHSRHLAIPLVLLAILAAASAGAIVVDTTEDRLGSDCALPGLCTLRQAIFDANAAGGGSVELTAGETYRLAQGALTVDPGTGNTITVLVTGGPSPLDTAIDGGASGSVVFVSSGQLDLSGVTIRNGDAGALEGGGIALASNAVLDLSDAIVTGNIAEDGGGLWIPVGASASLTRVLISGNEITRSSSGIGIADGGGIMNLGDLVMVATTVSGNFGTIDEGGGLHVPGCPRSSPVVVLRDR